MKIITSKGLWVSSSFTEKFGSKDIKPAKTVPPFKTLTKSMYDSEIKSEFGATESTLEDVAAFLKDPPEGTKDGYSNIFYVSGFVVRVYWGAGSGEWYVDVWSLDVYRWDAGVRVFFRNSPDALAQESSDSLDLDAAIAMVKEAGYTVVKIV